MVTSNHFVTHSSHRYSMLTGDATTRYTRGTTDGIDANGRLHSVARAPKFESFREIEGIMAGREPWAALRCSLFRFSSRILSRNFAATRLPRSPSNSIISLDEILSGGIPEMIDTLLNKRSVSSLFFIPAHIYLRYNIYVCKKPN